jgi:hypothetical protein
VIPAIQGFAQYELSIVFLAARSSPVVDSTLISRALVNDGSTSTGNGHETACNWHKKSVEDEWSRIDATGTDVNKNKCFPMGKDWADYPFQKLHSSRVCGLRNRRQPVE